MSLWVLAGCALIGVVAGAAPALRDRWQARHPLHACRFATSDCVPGAILHCPTCDRTTRVDPDGWPITMTRREARRWRKTGVAA